jgi:RNA polymerase primary sigma factor
MKKNEKAIKKLVELGRKNGCLTYEELNDIIPDTVVSSEDLDNIFTVLGKEDIKIVDSKEAAEAFMKKESAKEEDPEKEPAKERKCRYHARRA